MFFFVIKPLERILSLRFEETTGTVTVCETVAVLGTAVEQFQPLMGTPIKGQCYTLETVQSRATCRCRSEGV